MSAAKSNANQQFTSDPFYGENGMMKLGFAFSDRFSIESFLHKQLMLMKSSSLLDEKWKTMIWRGVDIIANQRDAVGV